MCTHTHVYRQTDRRTDSHTDTQALFSFPCDGHHAILPCTTSTTWPCTNIGHVLTSTATAKAPGPRRSWNTLLPQRTSTPTT